MLDDPTLVRMKNDVKKYQLHYRQLEDKARGLRSQKQQELDRLSDRFDHDIARVEQDMETTRRQMDNAEREISRQEDRLRKENT